MEIHIIHQMITLLIFAILVIVFIRKQYNSYNRSYLAFLKDILKLNEELKEDNEFDLRIINDASSHAMRVITDYIFKLSFKSDAANDLEDNKIKTYHYQLNYTEKTYRPEDNMKDEYINHIYYNNEMKKRYHILSFLKQDLNRFPTKIREITDSITINIFQTNIKLTYNELKSSKMIGLITHMENMEPDGENCLTLNVETHTLSNRLGGVLGTLSSDPKVNRQINTYGEHFKDIGINTHLIAFDNKHISMDYCKEISAIGDQVMSLDKNTIKYMQDRNHKVVIDVGSTNNYSINKYFKYKQFNSYPLNMLNRLNNEEEYNTAYDDSEDKSAFIFKVKHKPVIDYMINRLYSSEYPYPFKQANFSNFKMGYSLYTREDISHMNSNIDGDIINVIFFKAIKELRKQLITFQDKELLYEIHGSAYDLMDQNTILLVKDQLVFKELNDSETKLLRNVYDTALYAPIQEDMVKDTEFTLDIRFYSFKINKYILNRTSYNTYGDNSLDSYINFIIVDDILLAD